MKKGKIGLMLGILVVSSVTVGASVGVNVTAKYYSQKVEVNGVIKTQDVLNYKGSTYVPLRKFGEMTGVAVDYKDGKVIVGKSSSASTNDTIVVVPQPIAKYGRNNPAPIGVTQTLESSKSYDKYTVQVTLKEIIRGNKAWEMIKTENQFNDEAPAGKEYILAKFNVKALKTDGDKSFTASKYDFKGYTSTNSEYKNESVVVPEPELYNNLYAGGSTDGYVVLTVDKADKTPKVAYNLDYDGSGGLWFNLY